MSFSKPENSGYRGGKVPEVDITKCPAYGCKCRATVRIEGGSWCCGVHAHAQPEVWQSLTHRMNEHDWLAGFIDEIQKMDRACQPWRQFAVQFWENSDKECQPHKQEEAIPYQNRMRDEFLFRVGQLARRPAVRLPKPVKPGGQFAQREAA